MSRHKKRAYLTQPEIDRLMTAAQVAILMEILLA
jgi:hypothetical protein